MAPVTLLKCGRNNAYRSSTGSYSIDDVVYDQLSWYEISIVDTDSKMRRGILQTRQKFVKHPVLIPASITQKCIEFLKIKTIEKVLYHYGDGIMDMIASQITSLTVVYSTVYSGADQRKHQSSASLAFVREIHRGPVNSPHKWPVTRKMFPFDDVIMLKLL